MSGVADRFQFHAFGWGLMVAFFWERGGVRGWISYREVGDVRRNVLDLEFGFWVLGLRGGEMCGRKGRRK